MAVYGANGTELSAVYDNGGNPLSAVYDKNGIIVWTGDIRMDYDHPVIRYYKTIGTQNCQGMALYNDVLFQFRGHATSTPNDTVCLYNWKTGATIAADMYIDSGHANAVSFSKTFYDPEDEFPLIYCGDWFNPIIHVNRITRESATHLYDIVLPEATVGYYSNPCIDYDNNILYTIGYYQESTSDPTDNYCIVCKWDLSQLTDNGDGTYTPAFISTFNCDYIYIMQDLKFNDGYIWITAGGHDNPEHLYGMDPADGTLVHSLLMPTVLEIEGLSWQIDNETASYFAYVGFAGGVYYKLTFNQL